MKQLAVALQLLLVVAEVMACCAVQSFTVPRIPQTEPGLHPGTQPRDVMAMQQPKMQTTVSLSVASAAAAPVVQDALHARRHEAAAAAAGHASHLSLRRFIPQHRRALRASDPAISAKVEGQLANWLATTATTKQQRQVAQLQGKAVHAVLPAPLKIPALPASAPQSLAAPKRRLLTGVAVPAGLEEWAKTATPEQLAQLALLGLTDPAALPGPTLQDVGGRKLLQAGIGAWLLTTAPEELKQAALLRLTSAASSKVPTLQEVVPGGRKLRSDDVSCVPGLDQWAQQQATPEEVQALELLCGTAAAADHTSAAAEVTLQQVVGNGTRKLAAAAAHPLLRGAPGGCNKR